MNEKNKEHIDIIEKELKALLVDGLLDLLMETGAMDRIMEYTMDYFNRFGRQEQDTTKRENSKKSNSVRKVVVGE